MIAALLALTCASGTTLYDDGTARIFAAGRELYACGPKVHALYPAYKSARYSAFTRVGSRVVFEATVSGTHTLIAAGDDGSALYFGTAPGEDVQAFAFDAAGGMAVLEGGEGLQTLAYAPADGRQSSSVAAATDAVPASFAVAGETASWTTTSGAPGGAMLPVFQCADGTASYDDGAGTRLFEAGGLFWACTPSVRTPRRLFRYFPHSLGDRFEVLGRDGDRLLVVDDWEVQFSEGSDAGWLDLRTAGLHVSGLGFVRGGVRAMAAGEDGDVAVLEPREIDYARYAGGRLGPMRRIARVRGVVPASLRVRDGVVRWRTRSGDRAHARGDGGGQHDHDDHR